jgi:hypothetical protein
MTLQEIMAIAYAENSSGRILGKEYANFVLGALQAQMQIDAEAGGREANIKLIEYQIEMGTIEQNFKMQNLMPLDVTIKQKQIAQLQADIDVKAKQMQQIDAEILFKKTQKAQVEQSVYDNRQIKIMDALADMTGMILNGGTQAVPANLSTSLANAITNIAAITKETIA